jgi:hypothetical protein
MNPSPDLLYITSLEEVCWGGILVALTMAMHGFGMLGILRVQDGLKRRFNTQPTLAKGMFLLMLASWMILLVHLLEVFLWAGFYYWKGAVNSTNANASLCYYFALNEYTTLGSNYNLILRWRLLEGMNSVAGLLTFAWSTGALLTLVQDFQEQQLLRLRQKREKPHPMPAVGDKGGT